MESLLRCFLDQTQVFALFRLHCAERIVSHASNTLYTRTRIEVSKAGKSEVQPLH